jgi:hypothetical protein
VWQRARSAGVVLMEIAVTIAKRVGDKTVRCLKSIVDRRMLSVKNAIPKSASRWLERR